MNNNFLQVNKDEDIGQSCVMWNKIVTDSPLYMLASDVTFRSIAVVRPSPFHYCVLC